MKSMEKFIIRTESKDDYTIVFIGGDLDLAMAMEMRTVVEPLVEQTGRKLILNLKDLNYIDSTGIGIILSILKARAANNGLFFIEDIPSKINRLFDMTGISKFFPTDDDASLRKDEEQE